MKTSKSVLLSAIILLSLGIADSNAQDVGPIKGAVIKGGRPHRFEFAVIGNGALPYGDGAVQGGSGLRSALKLSPEFCMNYCLSNHFLIGIDGSYSTADPAFNLDNYAAPFANKGFATIRNEKSNFTSTSVLLTGGYLLRQKAAADKARAKDLSLRLGAGISFNSFPNQLITQTTNGSTDIIASYQIPAGYHKTSFILKPAVQFNYWLTPFFGLNVTAQYQLYLGKQGFAYHYKDLSGINFNAVPPTPTDVLKFQIKNAPDIYESTNGITGMFSFGGGICFAINGKNGDYRHGKGVKNVLHDPGTMRSGKPNRQADSNSRIPQQEYQTLLDSLRKITVHGLPNPIDHINGGPGVIASPAIDCICTETHWGTCDSDWGEVCGCDGYQTDRTNHGGFYIPKDSLIGNPFLVYKANPKNKTSLENKEFIVTKKIKLAKALTDSMGVEEAYILPGVYKFSSGNVVSLPVKITVTPASALYHAITEKGLDGGPKGKPLCPCSCCEKSPGVAWRCCTP